MRETEGEKETKRAGRRVLAAVWALAVSMALGIGACGGRETENTGAWDTEARLQNSGSSQESGAEAGLQGSGGGQEDSGEARGQSSGGGEEDDGEAGLLSSGGGQEDSGEARIQSSGGGQGQEFGASLGTVRLKDGDRILLNRESLDGTPGVVVLGEDLSIEQIITDKQMDSLAKGITANEPVVMTSLAQGTQGLYRISEDRWAVEPVYDYLSEEDDGTYSGSRDGDSCRIFQNPENGSFEERSGSCYHMGSFWWQEKEKGIFRISREEAFLGGQEETAAILDFSGRPMRYRFEMRDKTIFIFEDGGQQAYDQEGQLLFSKEPSDGEGDIREITSQALWLATWDDSISSIYNYREGRTVTQPEDKVEKAIICDGRGYYVVARNGGRLVCDDLGQPVFTSDGQLCDRILEPGYIGSWKDGILTIEKPATEEHYQISCPQDTRGSVTGGNVFYLSSEQGDSAVICRGSQILMEGRNLGYSMYPDYCIIYNGEEELVMDRQGQILFESREEGGHFLGEYAGCLLIRKDSAHLWVTDKDGVCGLQIPLGSEEPSHDL